MTKNIPIVTQDEGWSSTHGNDFHDFLISPEHTSTHRQRWIDVQVLDRFSSMLLSPAGRKILHALFHPILRDLVHNGNRTKCCSQRDQTFK